MILVDFVFNTKYVLIVCEFTIYGTIFGPRSLFFYLCLENLKNCIFDKFDIWKSQIYNFKFDFCKDFQNFDFFKFRKKDLGQ